MPEALLSIPDFEETGRKLKPEMDIPDFAVVGAQLAGGVAEPRPESSWSRLGRWTRKLAGAQKRVSTAQEPVKDSIDELKAIGLTAKGMLYGEGLPKGLGALQKPTEVAVDWLTEDMMTPEEEKELQVKYPNLMSARYAAASLLLPGVAEKIASPQEMEEWTKKPAELQRAGITGLAAQYAAFGALTRGAGEGAAYLAAKYPALTKKPLKALTESTWWRRLTIRERGVAVQTAAQRKAAGLSDAELKVELDNFYSNYLRRKTEAAAKGRPVPPEPEAPAAPKPPKAPAKPAPTTKAAKDFEVAIRAEKKPSVLAELKKAEAEPVDFEAVGRAMAQEPVAIEAPRVRGKQPLPPAEPIEMGAPKPIVPAKKPPIEGAEEIDVAGFVKRGVELEDRLAAKYEAIKDLPEVPPQPGTLGKLLERIDDQVATPKEVTELLTNVARSDKAQAAEAAKSIKSVIADNIGDIIDTYRSETRADGVALESYVDSLLKATEEYTVPPSKVRPKAVPPRAEVPKARELPRDRGIAKPPAPPEPTEVARKGIEREAPMKARPAPPKKKAVWDMTPEEYRRYQAVKARPEIPERLKSAFGLMKDQVAQGGLERAKKGYVMASTYPKWFRGKGWSKKQFNVVLDKVSQGKILTDKQYAMYEELLTIAERLKKTDRELILGEDAAALQKKGFEPIYEEVTVGDLKQGDRFIIRGEEFQLKQFDKQGNAIIEDGRTIKADVFEKIEVEGIKRVKEPMLREELAPEVAEERKEYVKKQSDDITYLYSGFPINEATKALKKTYQKHIGDPVWNYVSETLPLKAGERSDFIDKVNKGLILDYRKAPEFVELRDDTAMRIQQKREKAKEVAVALSEFPRAEQIRIAQIISGGVTATPKRYEKAFGVIKEFQQLEKDLQALGLLGPDNRFRQLSRKEIAKKFREIKEVDVNLAKMKKRLEPVVKYGRMVRTVSEDVTEEVLSMTKETATGMYKTDVSKWTELNEKRIMEALESRGFAPGEAEQMIARVKESVTAIEGQEGTLKEIKQTIEKVVTKTITQEIEKLKTYSPSMMARARGSILKDINKLHKDRAEILERIRLHYKMSGKQYLTKAYAAIEEEKSFIKDLLFRVRKRPRLIKGYEKRRKDLTKEYEDQLRRIRQAPYLVYKGLSSESHDVELMKMFVAVSENKKWAISPKELQTMRSIKTRAAAAEKYKDFKPLPVSERLGPLSGAMVDPYIWDDLNQTVAITNDWVKAWDNVVRLWKTGKVVYNPATQVRNMLSNTILADWAGLNPHRVDIYAEAARDLLKKTGYYKEVKDETTLLGTEWAGAEIKKFLSEAAEWETGDFSVKTASVFKKVLDAPGKMYQGVEQFFKLAIYINERKQGASVKDAAKHAEKYIFNYLKIPPAIRWAKRWYSPFITFTYKALPRAAETAVREPWKFAKYLILMKAVEEISRRMYGESEEEIEREKRVLPGYMRKEVLPGQLGHLRVPYKDKYDRSKYLDLTFILPWGDIGEQWGQGELPFPLRAVPRPFMPNMPFYMIPAEVGFNEVFFTGQELILKSDDWHEASAKIGKQVWRQLVPSLAGSYGYNKVMAAWHGDRDWAMRDRSLGEALFDSFLGIKLRSIDYYEELGNRMREIRKERNEIKRVYSRKLEDLYFRNPTPDVEADQRKAQKIYQDLNRKISKLMDKITEIQTGRRD